MATKNINTNINEEVASEIMQDLAKTMPQEAMQDNEKFVQSCREVLKKAQFLLNKIEQYEHRVTHSTPFVSKSSVGAFLYTYYSSAKNVQALRKLMIEAYAFVHYLREWLTGVAIEYIIVLQNKQEMSVLHLTLEELLRMVNIGTSASKGLRLSISGTASGTSALAKDLDHFSNFEKELQIIQSNLLQLQTVVKRKNEKQGIFKTERLMHQYGITGDKLNKGFVIETAVNMYAVFGTEAKTITISSPDGAQQLADAYSSTVGSLPGTRGGDINEEKSRQFLKQEGEDFQKRVEFQVKKAQGLFGATVIEISTLKTELFNIALLIAKVINQGPEVLKKTLTEYVTSSEKASTIKKNLVNELDLNLEKGLSKALQVAFKQQLK